MPVKWGTKVETWLALKECAHANPGLDLHPDHPPLIMALALEIACFNQTIVMTIEPANPGIVKSLWMSTVMCILN